MEALIIDPNTKQPFKTTEEVTAWLDLRYLMETGKHRRPHLLRWKKKTKVQQH